MLLSTRALCSMVENQIILSILRKARAYFEQSTHVTK